MPHIDQHPPGAFCWIELGTTNQAAAKHFYESLFGWKSNDMSMGPDGVYTIFQLEGRDAAAGYTLDHERQAGVPPNWMVYIAVNSADEAAARAGQLGAKVVAPPFDVFDAGRMALIEDPTGAMFAMWQAKRNTGIGIEGVDGTLCWADLMTADLGTARKFYADLFGWQVTPGPNDPSGYLHIKNGDRFIGGMPPGALQPGVPPHWMIYLLASNCDATADKAKSLGAHIVYGPTTMENVGRWAVVADPQGAIFAIFQPLPHQ